MIQCILNASDDRVTDGRSVIQPPQPMSYVIYNHSVLLTTVQSSRFMDMLHSNCTPIGRASDTMIARLKEIHFSWLWLELFRLLLGPSGFKLVIFFCLKNLSGD